MRIRSYVVFHRIYESMVLGMHPVFAYPRRSRVAPPEVRWICQTAGFHDPPVTIRLLRNRET